MTPRAFYQLMRGRVRDSLHATEVVWTDRPTAKRAGLKRLGLMMNIDVSITEKLQLQGERNRKSSLPSIDLENRAGGSFDEIWIWRPSWEPSAWWPRPRLCSVSCDIQHQPLIILICALQAEYSLSLKTTYEDIERSISHRGYLTNAPKPLARINAREHPRYGGDQLVCI